jgi:hypothetical protein
LIFNKIKYNFGEHILTTKKIKTMEDKTIVSSPIPVTESFAPPPIRRQQPTMPVAPTMAGLKNIAIQRAGIATAAGLALIGATAYAIMIHDEAKEDVVETPTPSVIEPTPIVQPEPIVENFLPPPISTPPPVFVAPTTPKIPMTAQPVANAVVHSEAPIATTVSNDMDFNHAFASARTEVGAGGAFVWKGKVYDTYYNEEWDAMSGDQQGQYNHSVHVTIPEENHAIAAVHTPTIEPLSISTSNEPVAIVPEEKPITIDKPITVAEPIYVTAKGVASTDNLLIDKPDLDSGEVSTSSFALPNEGAIAAVVKEMNLPKDMHAQQADNNGDGVTDAILVTDNEGHLHAILVDENQNGIFEQAVLDTNNNHKPDLYIVDANEDGTIDQEKVLQDSSSDFHSSLLNHNDTMTLHEEHNNMMMNDAPDFDNHTDFTDFS